MLRLKSVVSLLAVGLVMAAPIGVAQAEMKIGVVQFGKLADDSPQAKALSAALEREFGQRNRELVQQDKDLKAKQEKLQRDGAVMSEAERNKSQKELIDGQREAARRQNEFKEDFELRRNEELGKLQRLLVQEVQAYAKAQGFDLIISNDTVVYRKDAIDITAQVAAAMQEKNGKAAAPAPKP
jgi:outer membrane protein